MKKNISFKIKNKLYNKVYYFFQSHPTELYNYKQISKKLDLKNAEERSSIILIFY